jgi:hypothetical protein
MVLPALPQASTIASSSPLSEAAWYFSPVGDSARVLVQRAGPGLHPPPLVPPEYRPGRVAGACQSPAGDKGPRAGAYTRDVNRLGLWGLLLLLAGSGPVLAGESCTHFQISGEVKGEQTFRAAIGSGLAFRMEPADGGWVFEIGPAQPTEGDPTRYVDPVNPPYRGRRPNLLGPSYDVPAQDALGDFHEFWFLLSRDDAKVADRTVEVMLSPGTAEVFDQALGGMRRIPKGRGKVFILESDIVPGKSGDPANADYGRIDRIKFRVEFAAPASFVADPALKPKRGSCPDLRWDL